MVSDLAQLLTLPKRLVLEEIGKRDCIHNADFDLSDRECWDCEMGVECLSLLKHFQDNNPDEVSSQSTHKQEETIAVARNYIQSKIKQAEHDIDTCACELCTWMRELDSD